MQHLIGRNRTILYEHEKGRTMADIAREYGISRERVRQIVVYEGGVSMTRKRWREDRAIRLIFKAVAVAARHEQTRAHGTLRRYSLGCKCEACLTANADQHRAWYYRRFPKTKPYSQERREAIRDGIRASRGLPRQTDEQREEQ